MGPADSISTKVSTATRSTDHALVQLLYIADRSVHLTRSGRVPRDGGVHGHLEKVCFHLLDLWKLSHLTVFIDRATDSATKGPEDLVQIHNEAEISLRMCDALVDESRERV